MLDWISLVGVGLRQEKVHIESIQSSGVRVVEILPWIHSRRNRMDRRENLDRISLDLGPSSELLF